MISLNLPILTQDMGQQIGLVKELKAAVFFAYAYHSAAEPPCDKPSELAELTMLQMLDIIRDDGELYQLANNTHLADFCALRQDLLAVISLASCIPALSALIAPLQVRAAADQLLPRNLVFEGLMEADILREFSWRLERLTVALYSLPVRVV